MQDTASADGAHRAGREPQGLQIALLPARGVVRIAGSEAVPLLQGILTQDLDLLERQGAVYAGLLTPQGKILFDFFLARSGDALLLDAPRDKIADLIKRLTLYRLRAKVTFTEMPDMTVAALWGDGLPPPTPEGSVVFADPRLAALGWRVLRASAAGAGWMAALGTEASEQDWHAHRIGLGVPEGGRDFAYGDAFPHEADMDQLAGVSFSKGCYVGQEVVSRMQHRGTARKRFVQVRGDGALTTGTAITAGTASIGSIASVDGANGLALLRLDRAAEAKSKGEAIKAGEVGLEIVKPAWATFDLIPAAREASHDL